MKRDEFQGDRHEAENWRRALASGTSADVAECPPAEHILSAVRGQVDEETLEALVDHTTHCSACTVAWRLARDAYRREHVGRSTVTQGPWRRNVAAAAAVAALLTFAIGLGWYQQTPDAVRVAERSIQQAEIESLVSDQRLSREQCLLKWSAPQEDLAYDLWVSTEDLTLITRVEDLSATEYEVASDLLAEVPTGAKLLWGVKTTLTNGSTLESATFINLLE